MEIIQERKYIAMDAINRFTDVVDVLVSLLMVVTSTDKMERWHLLRLYLQNDCPFLAETHRTIYSVCLCKLKTLRNTMQHTEPSYEEIADGYQQLCTFNNFVYACVRKSREGMFTIIDGKDKRTDFAYLHRDLQKIIKKYEVAQGIIVTSEYVIAPLKIIKKSYKNAIKSKKIFLVHKATMALFGTWHKDTCTVWLQTGKMIIPQSTKVHYYVNGNKPIGGM